MYITVYIYIFLAYNHENIHKISQDFGEENPMVGKPSRSIKPREAPGIPINAGQGWAS
jgi:hypothetical protein